MLTVEIIYIPLPPAAIVHLKRSLDAPITVGEVLDQVGLLIEEPSRANVAVGIFSKKVTYDTLVANGDRIEIYRPLLLDPKEKRRKRARG